MDDFSALPVPVQVTLIIMGGLVFIVAILSQTDLFDKK